MYVGSYSLLFSFCHQRKLNHVHFAIIGGHLKMVKYLSKYGRKAFETPDQVNIRNFSISLCLRMASLLSFLLAKLVDWTLLNIFWPHTNLILR
jgi:hypothetical protein